MSDITFPDGFVFGTATASYQIEGAVDEGGREASIWDVFSHTPGKVVNGDTGDVACDHYHRYRDDVRLMKELGIDSYRLSIAWPRIQPYGKGEANEEGFAFYEALLDELEAVGIEPAITLYHWDLPQALEDDGGWTNRETALRFADYAAMVHARLGKRVKRWITLNEPFCSSILGYSEGRHAPGRQEGDGALAAAHHLLLGHGLALEKMRAQAEPDEQIGITLNLQPVRPVSDSPEDKEAADRSLLLSNLIFTDPILAGKHPELARKVWGEATDFRWIQDGDLEIIGKPIDFLGVNYYFPSNVKAAPYREDDPKLRVASDIGAQDVIFPGQEITAMGWPVEADGFRRLLNWLKETYPALPPIYITENGCAQPDVVDSDGKVHDPKRVNYLEGHLAAVRDAISDGVDVQGYYCWSLMDNYEWAEGYAKRFGLVYVDYNSQERIPKDSYTWFKELIQANRR